MNPKYEASLRESTGPKLLMVRMMLQGRRNLALFVGLVALVVILWARWGYWVLIVPAVIWLAAADQHFHVKFIDAELQRRQSEQKDDATPQKSTPPQP